MRSPHLLWTGLVSLLMLLAAARPAAAADTSILPEDRRMDWKPGIPGGIPVYPVFANVKDAAYGAVGDGTADDTAAIQKAIDACPEKHAVLLPAGTYRLTAQLNMVKNGVVLRGEGPDKTKLINTADEKHAILFGGWDNPWGSKIVKGFAKGSTSIDVADASRLKAGDLLLIDQLNDSACVLIEGQGGTCTWAGREGGKRGMGQLVQLSAKEGNTLTLSRPLAFALQEALAPEAGRTSDKIVTGSGLEDLYIELTAPKRKNGSTVKIWNAMHCWVKNVECARGWDLGHVSTQNCLGCEIRDSYFHHAHAYGSGHGYGVMVFGKTTDTLVENNVFYNLNSGVNIGCCGPGNVIAYNFSTRIFGRDFPETNWVHADLVHHAAHPFLNLFEGNAVSAIFFDFYWGSSSHNTLFRNAADMRSLNLDGKAMTQNVVGVRIDKASCFTSAVGNVLGHEGIAAQFETMSDFSQPHVWSLGHPGDPKVAQTLFRHGNFDYVTKQTQWDSSTAERKLPPSLYLAAKPAWFGALAWPAIGPDASPMAGRIPAQERFLKMPARMREAQDRLYLGQYLQAAGKAEAAAVALKTAAERYADTPYGVEAKKLLEQAAQK
ncbi:MAG: hypothetical protein HS116_15260 [Planctomycetes bacterium]|nr:hypothetical protein [Planctomycetota bacterium]